MAGMETHATLVVNCLMLAMKSPHFKDLLANDTQVEYVEPKRFEFGTSESPLKTVIGIR